MSEERRLEELRRRVQQDPASVSFADLGEQCRRAGHNEEAVSVCRAGLERHPHHVPARVTLGRALVAVNRYDEAEREFEIVLEAAPDNFFALRALAEIQKRRPADSTASEEHGEPADVATFPTVQPRDDGLRGGRHEAAGGDSPREARPAVAIDIFLERPRPPGVPGSPHPAGDPVLRELEDWLSAILSDRASRSAAAP